jgi:glycosyltransferase involved in cell wall biosynthesis
MRGAKRVTVVNEFTARYARRWNDSVTVIPMAIDLKLYSPVDPGEERPSLVIGWAGTKGSFVYLERVGESLAHVTDERVRLRLVTGWPYPPTLPGVRFDRVAWTLNGEIESLRTFDIGIAPLGDAPFDQGKFPYKILQFMALGLPVVASAAGTPSEIITHGVDGLLAEDANDWIRHLRALSNDPDLRRRLGSAARRTVERRFSLEVIAPRLASEILALK